jgi:hypothetical protein
MMSMLQMFSQHILTKYIKYVILSYNVDNKLQYVNKIHKYSLNVLIMWG